MPVERARNGWSYLHGVVLPAEPRSMGRDWDTRPGREAILHVGVTEYVGRNDP